MDFDPSSWLGLALELVRERPWIAPMIAFVFCLIGGLPVVAFLVPSAPFLAATGGLLTVAGAPLWPVGVAAMAGSFAGDILTYGAGRRWQRALLTRWPLSLFPDAIPKTEKFLVRWGGVGLIAAKFLGGLRAFMPLAAGIGNIPLRLFLAADAAACILYCAVLLTAGSGIALLWF